MSWDCDVKHLPGQDTRLDNAGCARGTAELGRIGSRRRRCAAPRPALPAPGSGLGRPRPARPRRPVPGGTADLTGSFNLAGRTQWQPSSSRAVSSRGGRVKVAARSAVAGPAIGSTAPGSHEEDGSRPGIYLEVTSCGCLPRGGKMPECSPRVMAARRVETPSLR